MDYHLLTKKCDGMCDSCECPPADTDPTLKPDIAALKKRLAEDPGFAAQVAGDRPLRRNVDGVCTRSTCECEREGLGDQCVWLKPVDAQEHVERLSQYVMQQDMRIADLERDAMRYRFIRTADHVPISSEAARDPVAYDAAIDREIAKNLPPSCKTRAGCSENGCLGWCDEYKP